MVCTIDTASNGQQLTQHLLMHWDKLMINPIDRHKPTDNQSIAPTLSAPLNLTLKTPLRLCYRILWT